ncbi:hypothetical protein [Campylobacter mucosalis]|uniref:Uncharacterized protein n=1 Tax=Campylobacter mucosalis CCUG 21559 TaxID=1032067 RepID=A0A6G5QGT0_9BACT|nr:hypothetical protein [Campylobacter mucosalis]QCD44117.1 hypothetical protein CMUC_0303 [Campylobacter mucosalis CCUG 21559]QCD44706.1 hypothetical protein CMUC_0917 [Campylobacter mucosalis CCUG 21559]
MAFYNPNRVDFNPSNGIIGAVGKVGDALWDIYKTNVEKNQNQARLDETARHNEAVEKHASDNLAATEKWRGIQKVNADREYELSVNKFNAENDFRKKQQDFNQFYKNQLLAQRQDALNEKRAIQEAKAKEEELDPLKNLPVGTKNKIDSATTLLDGINGVANEALVNNKDKTTGVYDALMGAAAYTLGVPSASNADVMASIKAYGDTIREQTKGGGNVAKSNAEDKLNPFRVSGDVLSANVSSEYLRNIENFSNIITSLSEQGNYKAANYLQKQLDTYIKGYENTTGRKYKSKDEAVKSEAERVNEKFSQKLKSASDPYDTLDENGVIYLN